MRIEDEYPVLRKLFRAGFERPINFDVLQGKELGEWLLAASLPDSLLAANAACRDAIHPAFPSGEAFGHLRHLYKTRLARKGAFSELSWLASFGYLPVLGKADGWGHPWLKLTDARLILDVEDKEMFGAFVLWRISVLADLAGDRKTKIVPARNRRLVN